MTAIGEAVSVGTWNGLLRSTDQGRTWSRIGRGMDGRSIKYYEGVFRSADGGAGADAVF